MDNAQQRQHLRSSRWEMKLPAALEGGISAMVQSDKSAIIAADKSALRFDKSPTHQSRYGDGALQGLLAKANK